MKNAPEHEFENSHDYGHCLICRVRGFFVSGEWFHHNQHRDPDEVAASKLRHPSQQEPAGEQQFQN